MIKILQLLLVLGFLVFTMPQTFSQEQNKPICSFCKLKATGAEKCQKIAKDTMSEVRSLMGLR